jgi:hypothetical protein
MRMRYLKFAKFALYKNYDTYIGVKKTKIIRRVVQPYIFYISPNNFLSLR